MKIIIAPAKKMVVDTDTFNYEKLPYFMDETKSILDKMKQLSYKEAKKLWQCSDKLAEENYQRLQDLDLNKHLTPALIALVESNINIWHQIYSLNRHWIMYAKTCAYYLGFTGS